MKVNVEDKKYDYEGCHATGDILLNEYPENMVDLVRDCIKYSNLTVVSEHIKQFTPEAATVVWILAESHFLMSISETVKNIFNNPFNSTQNALQYTH